MNILSQGDALQVLRTLGPDSFDGCLTDPPYGLSFMGKAWDHGVPGAETWAEVLRVLKPGAMLLAFGGLARASTFKVGRIRECCRVVEKCSKRVQFPFPLLTPPETQVMIVYERS